MSDVFSKRTLPFLEHSSLSARSLPAATIPLEGLAGASNPISVVLEVIGDDMTTVNYMDNDYHMTICYEDGECDREDSGKSGVGGRSRSIIAADSNRTVVGVEVDMRIEDAPGKVLVAERASDDGVPLRR
jgi:hypothetical protein